MIFVNWFLNNKFTEFSPRWFAQMRNISSFVFLLFSLNIYLFSQNGDLPLVALVREGNISAMKKALHHVDMNATYGEDGETLLYHAIDSRQLKAARLLLKKGADPNMRTDGKTPLIFAIGTQNADMAELLLNFGADVNGKDEKGNTPLIYAAYLGNIELARLLVSEGANYNYRNAAKKTALDYAIQFRNSNVSAYFRTLNADSETRNYPDFHDGPHIVWNGASGPFAFYMYRDSLSDAVGFETEQLPARKDSFLLRGFAGDTLDYFIRKSVPPDQAEYEQVPRIFVLGDIHGRYDEVQQILLEHEVMDSSLNWSWGNGHLLFIGDIFDRGDEVTQILWLIYRLEYQAKKAGEIGRAHV